MICKRGEGLDGTEPAVHMLAVARARVHANWNNVIVLINRDTASVLCRRNSEFQREFLFELKALILPLTILDNDL